MKRISFVRLAVCACGALAITAAAAFAQVDRATLVGTIRDASNAVVPGATVTARNTDTNISSHAITDAQVGQRARLDFTLDVASVEQAVTVEATSPLLNTEQALLGTVVRERRSTRRESTVPDQQQPRGRSARGAVRRARHLLKERYER